VQLLYMPSSLTRSAKAIVAPFILSDSAPNRNDYFCCHSCNEYTMPEMWPSLRRKKLKIERSAFEEVPPLSAARWGACSPRRRSSLKGHLVLTATAAKSPAAFPAKTTPATESKVIQARLCLPRLQLWERFRIKEKTENRKSQKGPRQ